MLRELVSAVTNSDEKRHYNTFDLLLIISLLTHLRGKSLVCEQTN